MHGPGTLVRAVLELPSADLHTLRVALFRRRTGLHELPADVLDAILDQISDPRDRASLVLAVCGTSASWAATKLRLSRHTHLLSRLLRDTALVSLRTFLLEAADQILYRWPSVLGTRHLLFVDWTPFAGVGRAIAEVGWSTTPPHAMVRICTETLRKQVARAVASGASHVRVSAHVQQHAIGWRTAAARVGDGQNGMRSVAVCVFPEFAAQVALHAVEEQLPWRWTQLCAAVCT